MKVSHQNIEEENMSVSNVTASGKRLLKGYVFNILFINKLF